MRKHFLLLVPIILLAVRSEALVYEYTYHANPWRFNEARSLEWGWNAGDPLYFHPENYERFDFNGSMKIDEALLPGGTLVNTTVFFQADSIIYNGTDIDWLLKNGWAVKTPLGYLDSSSQVDGLLSFDIHVFPAEMYSWISFSTDENRNIISWKSDFTDHYPDGGISDSGDYVASYHGEYYSAEAGTWSGPAVVPIPGTMLLFGSSLLALLAVRRIQRGAT